MHKNSHLFLFPSIVNACIALCPPGGTLIDFCLLEHMEREGMNSAPLESTVSASVPGISSLTLKSQFSWLFLFRGKNIAVCVTK